MNTTTIKRNLLKEIKRLPWSHAEHRYHSPNERNPEGTGWSFEESVTVTFKRIKYGIRLCQITPKNPMEVFIARIENGEGGGNNYHVSFTSNHFDEYGMLVVSPSLKRCGNKMFAKEPQPIGNYPARVPCKAARFVAGKLDRNLLPRLFAIADAKLESL